MLRVAQPGVVVHHFFQFSVGPARRDIFIFSQSVQRLVAHRVGSDAPFTNSLQAVISVIGSVIEPDQDIDAEVFQSMLAAKLNRISNFRFLVHIVKGEPDLRRFQFGQPPGMVWGQQPRFQT
mgnify:CR=1 FL=1